jgi:hypothetical protein
MQGSVCVKFGVCLQRHTSNAKILNFVLIHEGRAKSPAFFYFYFSMARWQVSGGAVRKR